MEIRGPFYNQKEAARYCGYSPSAFCNKLKGYKLPLVGPELNRYPQSVLDAFMANPEVFREQKRKARHKPMKVQV